MRRPSLATWFALLLVVAGALPWLASLVDGDRFRVAFAWVCHQQPARSLVLAGTTMVVCSRCAGIYAGLVIGALAPPRLTPNRLKWLTLVALGANAADWALGWAGAPVIHGWRLTLGAAFGASAAAWLLSSLRAQDDRGLTTDPRVVKTE